MNKRRTYEFKISAEGQRAEIIRASILTALLEANAKPKFCGGKNDFSVEVDHETLNVNMATTIGVYMSQNYNISLNTEKENPTSVNTFQRLVLC